MFGEVLKTGWLTKKSKKGEWKEGWWVLRPGILAYHKSEQVSYPMSTTGDTLPILLLYHSLSETPPSLKSPMSTPSSVSCQSANTVKGVIYLDNITKVSRVEIDEASKKQNCIKVSTAEREYIILAKGERLLNEWFTAIEKACTCKLSTGSQIQMRTDKKNVRFLSFLASKQ